MKPGFKQPRVTVTCHGYAGYVCYNEVDTTPQHTHDAKCPECKRRIHIISTTNYNKRIFAGRTVEKGKVGRKVTYGGDFIKPFTCKCCGKPLADCKRVKDGLNQYKPKQVETWKPWK